jgi:hypothetical protein
VCDDFERDFSSAAASLKLRIISVCLASYLKKPGFQEMTSLPELT